MVVSVEASDAREFEALMAESAIPWRFIGTSGGDAAGDRVRVRMAAIAIVDLDAATGVEDALGANGC